MLNPECFKVSDTFDQQRLHFVLNELLNLRYSRNPTVANLKSELLTEPELSPELFQIQQKLISSILKQDLNTIKIQELPTCAEEFSVWFSNKIQKYPDSPHPLFDYLAKVAPLADFRDFIRVEAGVHVSFDDVLAFSQIGVRGAPKIEFFTNFEDELGDGDPEKFHLTMFGRLISELNIQDFKRAEIEWQALACGNYMMFLAAFRCFYYYCIGYLGFLEALTPGRFARIAQGGVRLGLSGSSLSYHQDHAVLDIEHTQGWLQEVILPEINRGGPEACRMIAVGVLLRERVSTCYWDAMLRKYQK